MTASPTTRRFSRTSAEAFKGADYASSITTPGNHVLGFHGAMKPRKKIARAPKPSLHRLAPGPVAAVLRKLRWALRRVRWALLKMRGPL